MGSLCSRFKIRSRSQRYKPLRTESPTTKEIKVSNECAPGYLTDDVLTDSQFDEIAKEISQLRKPIDVLRASINNSLLLFKMALGLSKDSTITSCFEVLKQSVKDPSMSMELVNTADGPHKLSVPATTWSLLPENVQAAIKQFNSMMSSCHRFIGSRELKVVDIQLKLEDLQLLPLTEEKAQELQKLKEILPRIDEFTKQVETLFADISIASKLFDHQIDTCNGF